MFKKDFKVKSSAKIKKSEKNKIIDKLIRNYELLEKTDLDFLNKIELYKAKAECFNNQIITIYRDETNPLFFESYEYIFPTIYSLKHFIKKIPTFTIHDETTIYLIRGSDLMIPGIIIEKPVNPYSYGKLKKNQIVIINTTSNQCPFAIGFTALDSYDMFMSGGRGKAVNIMHVENDFLWLSGSKVIKPIIEHENVQNIEDLKEISEIENINLGENIIEEDNEELEFADISKDELDNLLENCFLHSLKFSIKDKCLPLNYNVVYSQYVIKYCPKDINLDLKNTSYKKFGNFMNFMKDSKVIDISETKGVYSVININREHEKLYLKKSLFIVEEEAEKDYIFPNVRDVYFITSKVLDIFIKYGYRKSEIIEAKDVRKCITDYVKENNIQNEDLAKVNLDPILTQCFLKSSENFLVISWKDLFQKAFDQLTPGIVLDFNNENVVLKNKSNLKIKIESFKRSNKMITRVTGNEIFRITDKNLASLIQQNIGCSCGIITDNSGIFAVQAQGDQKLKISRLLTNKYGVPNTFIETVVKK